MTEVASRSQIPPGFLIAVALVLAGSILAAGGARLTGFGKSGAPTGLAVEHHAFRFEDRADGAVVVRSAEAGAVIEVLEPGGHGFARSVLRGLARERRARGIDAAPPFWLTRWDDGRFSLDDPATGRSIELGAFGPTNAEAFAALLVASRGAVDET